MQDLAAKLAKKRLWRAKWTAYGMDKQSHYDMWRVSVSPTEYHTRLSLPNKGLRITFVEKREERGITDKGFIKVRFRFTECRVEALPPAPQPQLGEEYIRVT